MTAAKKAYMKKVEVETEGMTHEEKQKYMFIEDMIVRFENLKRELENELFPERYDMIGDSTHDSQMRQQGKNPMSEEYTEKVNERRRRLGFAPLGKDGLPVDSTTQYCIDLLIKKVKYTPNQAN